MTDGFDLLIRAARVIFPNEERPAAVGVQGGSIAAVMPADRPTAAARVLELDSSVVLMPGLVDSHVHICEPGHTDWEGFATATLAASAGGITTLVDMPLDSVPSTASVAALAVKREAARGQCHVDVGFWGGVIPGNSRELVPLRRAGVLGFKCFLADSGSDDFPHVSALEMEYALGVLRDLDAPLLVHAENAEAAASMPRVQGRHYADYLASRPRGIENLAVCQVIEAARRSGGRAHVVHLSSSDALPMIASARRDGVALTAETCPHYLILAAEEIAEGATACKCSPPVREGANRGLLWSGLRDGTLDFVVSDHSPATPEMKDVASGDFGAAWGGISSLQLGLPLTWTAARRRGFSLPDVAGWMSAGPARLAGLRKKGQIAVGLDADFCVFAPDETFTVDQHDIRHRHRLTPYTGRKLDGVVRATFLRGEPADGSAPRGQLLRPEAAGAEAVRIREETAR
jgi:allantoinase